MKDSWSGRGQWLLTRVVVQAWEQDGAAWKPVEPKVAARLWSAVFVPFKTVQLKSKPKITFGLVDIGGKKSSCTTIAVPALVKEQEAELTLTECPADPWRTRSIAVRGTKEGRKVLWAAER
jgi:hypothetical protein